MAISLIQTKNMDFINAVMQVIRDEVCEDGQVLNQLDSTPNDWYFRVEHDGEWVGFWHLHPFNYSTLQIHANFLPSGRIHAKEAAKEILKWVSENTPSHIKKLVAFIPVTRPNVYHFTKKQGFQDEGLIKNAWFENEIMHDVHVLGWQR